MVIPIQIQETCKLTGILNYWAMAEGMKLKYRLFIYICYGRKKGDTVLYKNEMILN